MKTVHTEYHRLQDGKAELIGGKLMPSFEIPKRTEFIIARRIAAPGLPTLFVMEGGYAVEAIGINAVNVLTGFEEAARP